MRPRTKTIRKISLRTLETPFQKDTNLDLTGLTLATIVGVMTLFLTPPNSVALWTIKTLEFVGILSAAFAIGLLLCKFIRNQRREEEKRKLLSCAKTAGMNMGEYVATRIIEEITRSLRKWADSLGIAHDYLKTSNFRHTIVFNDLPIDFVDIEVTDYRLNYAVRWHEPDYLRIVFDGKPNAKVEIVLTKDAHHIGPRQRIKINEENIRTLKVTLLESILYPAHTFSGCLLA